MMVYITFIVLSLIIAIIFKSKLETSIVMFISSVLSLYVTWNLLPLTFDYSIKALGQEYIEYGKMGSLLIPWVVLYFAIIIIFAFLRKNVDSIDISNAIKMPMAFIFCFLSAISFFGIVSASLTFAPDLVAKIPVMSLDGFENFSKAVVPTFLEIVNII